MTEHKQDMAIEVCADLLSCLQKLWKYHLNKKNRSHSELARLKIHKVYAVIYDEIIIKEKRVKI
jgi:hypothetical protein